MTGLGKLLERGRRAAGMWRIIFFAVLAVLAAANFVLKPHEPHFGLDAQPLFWPAFGLIVGVGMVLFVKKIIQPLIFRSENHYDDI